VCPFNAEKGRRPVPTDIPHFPARVVVTPADAPVVFEEFERRGGTADLVRRTGDVTIATDLGVPRSTARGWLGAAPTVVVCLDVADLTEPELRQELCRGGPPD
jgi:hypothetical protein